MLTIFSIAPFGAFAEEQEHELNSSIFLGGGVALPWVRRGCNSRSSDRMKVDFSKKQQLKNAQMCAFSRGQKDIIHLWLTYGWAMFTPMPLPRRQLSPSSLQCFPHPPPQTVAFPLLAWILLRKLPIVGGMSAGGIHGSAGRGERFARLPVTGLKGS